jgi:protein-disulfide isomerase
MRLSMFSGQSRWGSSSFPHEVWAKYAASAGVDVDEWRSCLNARTHRGAVEADRKLGVRMGVDATPTIFVGNRKIVGAVPFERLAAVVRAQMN